ncbi:hypothetical protein, partial [Paracoccus sp. PAR01]|uniref:hypothetical protein n=1 Tax=Paracoccus sp. PAR01 TaxID=2769282 RepID=UPI001CE08F8F
MLLTHSAFGPELDLLSRGLSLSFQVHGLRGVHYVRPTRHGIADHCSYFIEHDHGEFCRAGLIDLTPDTPSTEERLWATTVRLGGLHFQAAA